MSKEAEKLAEVMEILSASQRNPYNAAKQAAELIRRQAEQIRELREALSRLLNSDPDGAIAKASEDDLTEAANDANADPVIREQAASVLQARAALSNTKE